MLCKSSINKHLSNNKYMLDVYSPCLELEIHFFLEGTLKTTYRIEIHLDTQHKGK